MGKQELYLQLGCHPPAAVFCLGRWESLISSEGGRGLDSLLRFGTNVLAFGVLGPLGLWACGASLAGFDASLQLVATPAQEIGAQAKAPRSSLLRLPWLVGFSSLESRCAGSKHCSSFVSGEELSLACTLPSFWPGGGLIFQECQGFLPLCVPGAVLAIAWPYAVSDRQAGASSLSPWSLPCRSQSSPLGQKCSRIQNFSEFQM